MEVSQNQFEQVIEDLDIGQVKDLMDCDPPRVQFANTDGETVATAIFGRNGVYKLYNEAKDIFYQNNYDSYGHEIKMKEFNFVEGDYEGYKRVRMRKMGNVSDGCIQLSGIVMEDLSEEIIEIINTSSYEEALEEIGLEVVGE